MIWIDLNTALNIIYLKKWLASLKWYVRETRMQVISIAHFDGYKAWGVLFSKPRSSQIKSSQGAALSIHLLYDHSLTLKDEVSMVINVVCRKNVVIYRNQALEFKTRTFTSLRNCTRWRAATAMEDVCLHLCSFRQRLTWECAYQGPTKQEAIG